MGTVANSTSTMHKLLSKPIELERFEVDDFSDEEREDEFIPELIKWLETLRANAIREKEIGNIDKSQKIWKKLVRWLPEGWLQTRTVTMNYENLLTMYHQRKDHKLSEWSDLFMDFVKDLPYSENFIMIN